MEDGGAADRAAYSVATELEIPADRAAVRALDRVGGMRGAMSGRCGDMMRWDGMPPDQGLLNGCCGK
jgi:hypothetical protein